MARLGLASHLLFLWVGTEVPWHAGPHPVFISRRAWQLPFTWKICYFPLFSFFFLALLRFFGTVRATRRLLRAQAELWVPCGARLGVLETPILGEPSPAVPLGGAQP